MVLGDPEGSYGLTRRVAVYGGPVRGMAESTNGGRLVRYGLAGRGWEDAGRPRAERQGSRWRPHLVNRRLILKHRVHSILIAFWALRCDGRPVRDRRPGGCSTSSIFLSRGATSWER
jgi:hypothetical protein